MESILNPIAPVTEPWVPEDSTPNPITLSAPVTPSSQPTNSIDVPKEMAALARMTIHELRAKYRELYGFPLMVAHKTYLQKRIIWKLQSIAENLELGKEDWELVEALSSNAPIRMRQMHKKEGDDGIEPMSDESPEILDVQNQQGPRIPSEDSSLDDVFDENETLETVLQELMGEKGWKNYSLDEEVKSTARSNGVSTRELSPDDEITPPGPETPMTGPFPQSTSPLTKHTQQLLVPQIEVGSDVTKIAVVLTTPTGDLTLAFDLTARHAK